MRTLNPKSAFSFIKCGIKDPEKLIYATDIHKTELSNLTKTKLSSLQWFEFLWQIPFVNIAIIPPFKARWGGLRGGSFDINTLFSYVAKEKIDPHNALGVFPQPIWGRSHIM